MCRYPVGLGAKRVRQAMGGIEKDRVSRDFNRRAGLGPPFRRGRSTQVGQGRRLQSHRGHALISDLHLDPERPDITRRFGEFLDGEARGADALYILGDLFEAWVGDDDPSETGAFVADRLKALADAGVPVSFQRGNRDFLLGDDFARRAGISILPDPAVILLGGHPVLLMHGDLLCTDDTAYQQFRAQTRDPAWQHRFLSQPLEARLAFARQARAASQARQGELRDAGTMETITDVSPATVEEYLARYASTPWSTATPIARRSTRCRSMAGIASASCSGIGTAVRCCAPTAIRTARTIVAPLSRFRTT